MNILIYICFFLLLYLFFNIYLNKNKEYFNNNNNIIINNSFNNYGKQNIIPLLRINNFTKYVDKLKFKDLCKQKNIKTFKTLFILNKPNDLYKIYYKLPNSFILKSNKGAGRNVLVYNKNLSNPKILLNKLKNYNDPYEPINEPQYQLTKGKIYVEELIKPVPSDIKVYFYKNKPKILISIENRFSDKKYYIYKFENNKLIFIPDCFWGLQSSQIKSKLIENLIKNNKINYLIDLIYRFNINFPLIRYDFYWYKNDFYASEITFTSSKFNSKITEKYAKFCVT